MARLDWNAAGERFFETGLDRGVLYIDDDGYAWNGLVSVDEAHSGAENKASYLDGVRFLNRLTQEEFEATIEAYTYPDEFGKCDGTTLVANGLLATQQRRRSFGLSYRTKVGNDIEGADYGYKIHVVYDALAEPSDRNHQTQSDSTDAFNFSWHITTKPSLLGGLSPLAHFVIDSRKTPEALLSQIEAILYGDESEEARLPSAEELVFIFTSYDSDAYEAGSPLSTTFVTYDGGSPSDVTPTMTLDGGKL